MSPTIIAHLDRIARQTRAMVASDNVNGARNGRLTNVRDFYRPAELVRRNAAWITS